MQKDEGAEKLIKYGIETALKKIFKERIYGAFSLERQNNVDREALKLMIIAIADQSRLTEKEKEIIKQHGDMNEIINSFREDHNGIIKMLDALPFSALAKIDGRYTEETVIDVIKSAYNETQKDQDA